MHGDKKLPPEQKHDVRLKDKKSLAQVSWSEIRVKVDLFIRKIWRFTRKIWRQVGFENKTLWDWLQLGAGVAVPVVLFFAGQAIQEKSQSIANKNRNQDILSTYLEDITKLLLSENLRHSEANSDVRLVAQAKTVNVVRQLNEDPVGKGEVIRFLYITNLIGSCQIILSRALDCQPAILHLNETRLDQANVPSTAVFPGIYLNDAKLSEAVLTGIDLTNAQLQRANLKEANLDGAVLSNANLRSASLRDAHLLDAKMYRSILVSAMLENADLSNAILEDANLNNAFLKGAKLDHANLKSADLRNVSLSGASLRGAKLDHTNLQSADLRNVSLNGASLQGADLRNANLDGTSLQNTDLKGAKYSSTTQFPKDFDPGEKGMISVQ